MKRGKPSGGKKTHVPSDFKRLKAKVGKRAPKQLNSTDTKFDTATVKVQSQNVTHEKSDSKLGLESLTALASSRGKHLSSLMMSLNHHAANARSSALQGMKDAIVHTPAGAMNQHLALIVPSLAKCFVDEDMGVRRSAITILFQNVSQPMIVNSEDGGTAGESMRPFLQLVLAYIASALHSLDQDVRYDGCTALETLCSHYSDLFLDGGEDLAKLQATISAFPVLIDDVSGGLASMSYRGVGTLEAGKKISDSGSSKNKKKIKDGKQSKRSVRGMGVLKSFLAVQRIMTTHQNGYDILANQLNVRSLSKDGSALVPSTTPVNLTFVPGGRSSNALVWKCDQIKRSSIRNISNIRDFKKYLNIVCNSDSTTASQSSIEISSDARSGSRQVVGFGTMAILMSKLRDRLVEVTQRGNANGGELYLSPTDAQEFSLIINSVRLLWSRYTGLFALGAEDPLDREKVKSPGHSILNLVLDNFPVKDAGGKTGNNQKYDLLNSSACMVLSELGSFFDKYPFRLTGSSQNSIINDAQRFRWVNTIFAYIVPQLDTHMQEGNIQAEEMPSTTSNTRFTLLKVIEQLLLQHREGGKYILTGKKYMELLSCFADAYFPLTGLDSSTCKSAEGRRAASLLISLTNHFFTEGLNPSTDSSELQKVVLRMSSVLPEYLMKWRGRYPEDSTTVLATLLSITRRSNIDDPNADDKKLSDFCNHIRLSMARLFATSSKMRKIPSTRFSAKMSVFEELPEVAQKIALSLVAILRSPSEILVSSLSLVCSRRCRTKNGIEVNILSDEMIDYIMSMVHSMSRTLSLQSYLTFLVQSCGVHSAKYVALDSNKASMDTTLAMDTTMETNDKEEVSEEEIDTSKSDADILFQPSSIAFMTSYDKAIARTCRYLCLAKSKKIDIMMTPVLKSWVLGQVNETLPVRILKVRAAATIRTSISISLPSDNPASDDLRDGFVKSISSLLQLIPLGSNDISDDAAESLPKIFAPILVSS